MTPRNRRLGLVGLPALLLAAACGPSGRAPGTISVHLMDAPADFKEINLHIRALEAHSNATGWITLSRPDITTDILKLTGGVVETLAAGVELEPGRYTQFRLVLGGGNTVVLQDDTTHDLTVPSGLQTGVKLVCQVDVRPGAHQDVFIDFDGRHSVFLHGTGLPEKFILRPVIYCNQGPATPPETAPGATIGSITGMLTALDPTETLESLAGVTVTAQVLDASGKWTIAALTITDGNGIYALNDLPLGASYVVVSQPVIATGSVTRSWDARASEGLFLDAANPTRSFSALFGSPAATGGVSGSIETVTPNVNDVVLVRQNLNPLVIGAPPDFFSFIVRAALVEAAGAAFSVPDLPLGSYTLEVSRVGVSGASVPVDLANAGDTLQVILTFP